MGKLLFGGILVLGALAYGWLVVWQIVAADSCEQLAYCRNVAQEIANPDKIGFIFSLVGALACLIIGVSFIKRVFRKKDD